MAEPNETERRRWNDEEWAASWPKRERLTDEVTGHLLAASALRPGERVLDIGSGGGKAALAAAQAVGPEGVVIGADVSAPLAELAVQRARAADVGHVAFHVVDVQTDPIAGGPFDVAMSQFGVMFFDEPAVAFGNIRAHLEPGGRLAFACWQSLERNPWFYAAAVADFVPPPPKPPPGKSPTGPFALADAERTTNMLVAAGFTDVRRATHEITVDTPADSVVDDSLLRFMGIPADLLPAAQAAVATHMRQFELGSGLSRFPLAFQIFQAVAPT